MKRLLLQAIILLCVSCAAGGLANHFSPTRIQLFRHYVPAGRYQVPLPVASPLLNFHRDGLRVVFLDIRPPELFRVACIPGAINVPDLKIVPELLERLTRAPGVVCYGDDLGEAIELVAQLQERGVVTSVVLTEGWQGWKTAGFPTSKS